MDKQKKLEEIAREIERCRLCKRGKSGKAVPGEGNADADIVFLGEAPGRTEAATGRPFVGRSGKYLRSLIKKLDLQEEGVYITSPVKYLPDSGTPSITDIKHGVTHLEKQLKAIDPKIIVLLGAVASAAIFGKKLPVMKAHGNIIKQDGRRYFVTLHPAAAMRFPPLRKIIEKDFKKLKKLLSTN